jgi:hypothetical protein
MSSKYRRFMAILACAVLSGCAASHAPPSTHALADLVAHADIIDLTHTLDHEFPYIPVPGVTLAIARR